MKIKLSELKALIKEELDKPRQPGFYWIKVKTYPDATIGRWCLDENESNGGYWITFDNQSIENFHVKVLSDVLAPPSV